MMQARVVYSGTVQGVGFRYVVQRYASDLKLVGWVKNLRDGRVEILLEGKKNLIEQLLEGVDKHFDGYIKEKDVTYHHSEGRLTEFLIMH